MSRQSFLTLLLVRVGFPHMQFNMHSFRIEVATSAKAAYISDVHIQTLGHGEAMSIKCISRYVQQIWHFKDHCAAGSPSIVST